MALLRLKKLVQRDTQYQSQEHPGRPEPERDTGTEPDPPESERASPEANQNTRGRIDPIGALWQGLRHPWLLLVLGLIALLLILGALLFPQVPPELLYDGPATTRWMMSTSAEYGTLGQIMLNLGLFDVLHSYLLRILFGLIGLVLTVHLGDVVGDLIHRLRVHRVLVKSTDTIDEPLITSASSGLYQLRKSAPSSVSDTCDAVENHLRNSFEVVQRIEVELPNSSTLKGGTFASPPNASLSGAPPGIPPEQTAAGSNSEENQKAKSNVVKQDRFLAHRGLLARYLRPLLMIGLLTALIPVWLITSTGWELYPPPLAPGNQLSFESQGLEVRYLAQIDGLESSESGEGSADGETNAQGSRLISRAIDIRVGEEEQTLPLVTINTASQGADQQAGDKSVGIRINQVDIEAHVGPPGLLISTIDGSEDLVLPESSQRLASIGLVFPGAGNEKAVVLASQARVLRIVRSDDQAQTSYIFQLLDRDANPVGEPQRIDGTKTTTFGLETTGKALRFDPVPGVIIQARYLPGLWLMLVSLALVLIGAAGYWLRTGYILVQLSPWPVERTVAVAQSDSRSEIAAIRRMLIGNDNPHHSERLGQGPDLLANQADAAPAQTAH